MPMEEMSRYGSPRQLGRRAKRRQPIARARRRALRRPIDAAATDSGGGLTAEEDDRLFFGKDGAPRLDSVSLYSLGKLLGKGAFGAVKMGAAQALWFGCRYQEL